MMRYQQPKFGWQGINSSENIVERAIYFDHKSPHCDLDFEDSNNNKNYCTTLWLMMLHHHTKFGNKMFCDLEDIIQTNIH